MLEKIFIYIFIGGSYHKCALLHVESEKYQLAYGTKYLQRPDAIAIDPLNLPLSDQIYQSSELFGAILDCAPDRWGRYLLEKKFNRKLTDLECILSNGIEHVGALAFSDGSSEIPMQFTPTGFIPVALPPNKPPNLKLIMDQTELIIQHIDDQKRLAELLTYGPSLGGAKPKHHCLIDGVPFIAKFATSQDSRREQRLEFATMNMAKDLGVDVPHIYLSKVGKRDVYYIKRFDRIISKKKSNQIITKIPFISALSLCGWAENGYQDWSYLLLAEALYKIAKNKILLNKNLTELYQRIAFNIAVHNNDDHPRNHGVYFHQGHWQLAPLYDVVPMDTSSQSFTLAMELGIKRREASKSNLLSACEYFNLDPKNAEKIIDKTFNFVHLNWKKYFKNAGLTQQEIARFTNAMSLKL